MENTENKLQDDSVRPNNGTKHIKCRLFKDTPPQLKGRDCQTGFKRSATSSYALSVRNIL